MFAVGQLFTVMNGQHTTASNTYHLLDSIELQLWQVCVGTLLSGTLFRIARCNICWSTSPTVFLCSQPVSLKTTNSRKAVTWYVQHVNNWVTWHVTKQVGVACSSCMASRLCSMFGPSSTIDPLPVSGNLPGPCFRCRHSVCLDTGTEASLRYFWYNPLLLDGPELGIDSITSRSR